MATRTTFPHARPVLFFTLIALALTALRVAALILTDAELGIDEAQYWVWSREPAFGYFSKPPLIAWTIAATTGLFGNAEWAVRLAAPFFHLGTGFCLFFLGRRLYGAAAGFWAGIGWLTLPGVFLSAMLITTDAPLLFFWSAALYLFFRLAETRQAGGNGLMLAVLLGAAAGLGLLSKYAMIYFPLGAALALVFAPSLRRTLKPVDGAVAALAAAIVIAPNLLWNAQHDFHTLSHTAANANWRGFPFHPLKLIEFLGAQFGVFGPVFFALLLWGVASLGRRLAAAARARETDLALLAFSLTPLVVVSAQALISRAHANWAAAAYPGAMLLVIAWAERARLVRAVKAGVGLHVAAGAVFLIAMMNFAIVDALRLSNAVISIRGWSQQAAGVAAAAREHGYDAIVADERDVMGAVLYYGRGGPPVYALDSNRQVDHHYEAFMPLEGAGVSRALFATKAPEAIAPRGRFAVIEPLGEIEADVGEGRQRTIYLFGLEEPVASPADVTAQNGGR